MALEGTFSDFGLAEIFQLIGLQKKTGVLTVSGGGDEQMVTVSFDKGMITFADEYQRSETERLGNILLRSRLLTREALDKAIETQKETLQRMGHVLIQMGLITQQELQKALQTQVKETVYRLFRWKEGSYHFSSEPVSYDKEMYQPVSTEFLLMEGVRMIDEWPIIEKKITSFDMVFEKIPGREPRAGESGAGRGKGEGWDDLMSIVDEEAGKGASEASGGETHSGLSTQEQAIYRLVDGEKTVQDLIDIGKIGEFETCKILYSFLSVGMIRSVEEGAPAASVRAAGRRSVVPFADLLIMAFMAIALVVVLFFNPWSFFALNYNIQSSRDEVGSLRDDIKVQRLRHALEVFYLEKQTYPRALEKLPEDKLIRAEEIRDNQGRVFTYRGGKKDYQLTREGTAAAEKVEEQ